MNAQLGKRMFFFLLGVGGRGGYSLRLRGLCVWLVLMWSQNLHNKKRLLLPAPSTDAGLQCLSVSPAGCRSTARPSTPAAGAEPAGALSDGPLCVNLAFYAIISYWTSCLAHGWLQMFLAASSRRLNVSMQPQRQPDPSAGRCDQKCRSRYFFFLNFISITVDEVFFFHVHLGVSQKKKFQNELNMTQKNLPQKEDLCQLFRSLLA